MRIFKSKPTPNSPASRLMDDGYADAKAGRAALHEQLFETPVDYQTYMVGYDRGLVGDKPKGTLDPDSFSIKFRPDHSPFINCSGVHIGGSGTGFYY